MEMVIRGGKIFDAVHREPYSADIWVKDGKIAQIGGDFAASADAEAVDASGLNVYPGMVEAHGHIGLDGWAIGYEGQDLSLIHIFAAFRHFSRRKYSEIRPCFAMRRTAVPLSPKAMKNFG